MAEHKASLVIIAPTVEEAIQQGAEQLGVEKEDLEITILDEGTRGLFGLGNREARIRVSLQSEEDKQTVPAENGLSTAASAEQKPAADRKMDDIEQVTHDVVVELLDRMGVEAKVDCQWGEEVEEGHIRPMFVTINGSDLSVLIGKRAETLDALQYITRLIVAKEMDQPVAVVIDVQGYRARRERQLQNLAQRMAQQVVERGRSISLEPMPANERRIIHIALRDNPDVYTESIGERERRKVTIFRKQ
ncbi:MAG: protein jag [Anaerolineales bacterium]|nr:protein jag [Anaerolineales bacterium]